MGDFEKGVQAMHRFGVTALSIAALLMALLFTAPHPASAQQFYRVPDKKALKHLTTKQSSQARGAPGEKTTLDYYEAPNGQLITIHSFRGRNVAFSVHSNKSAQGSYRIFLDMNGDGNFQEVNNAGWQIPAWAK
jgi:hypothetical protein